MLEVYINYNCLEKGQSSSCEEITEESSNCATGGKNLSKRLVCLENRIRINAENLIILLGTSAAAIPNLDRYVRFWSFFVRRDMAEAEGERRRAMKAHWGTSIGATVNAAVVSSAAEANN